MGQFVTGHGFGRVASASHTFLIVILSEAPRSGAESKDLQLFLFAPMQCFSEGKAMRHRHLNHQEYSSAAIDSVIDRGKPKDWSELRAAALNDRTIMEKIFRVAVAHADDPYSPELYVLWRQYAEQHLRNVDGEQ